MSLLARAVLHRARGLDAVLANSLVRRLTIAAGAHRAHDQLLRRHERQLVLETATNPRRVHFETARDVSIRTRIASVARKLSGIMHDWQADPFARGSYTNVLVGGIDAWKTLARPMQRTLFFAGEATCGRGYNATMEGAVASGCRAAEELSAPGRSPPAFAGRLCRIAQPRPLSPL